MADPGALARRLQRQEILSTAAALSGDPVLSEYGGAQLGRLSKARQAAKQVISLGGGFYSQGGQIAQVPGYEEQEQRKSDRALKKALAVAEAKRTTRFEDWYAMKQTELNMPTRTQATKAEETLSFLPELQALAGPLQQGLEIPSGPEVSASVARGIPGVGEASAAGIERAFMEPEQVDWLARGRQMEQDITRLASGLQVTGIELENLKKFSPWALNLDPRERLKRLSDTYNKLGRKAAAIQRQPWENVDFAEGYETEATKSPQYPRSQIPPGTRVIQDPETGQRIGVTPDGRMFELD